MHGITIKITIWGIITCFLNESIIEIYQMHRVENRSNLHLYLLHTSTYSEVHTRQMKLGSECD